MSEDPGHTPQVSVRIANPAGLAVDEQRIEGIAVKTAESEGANGEISITIVDGARMAELNEEHMGHAGPTDVLSFPIDGLVRSGAGRDDVPIVIGEVVLCPEVAAAQAEGDVGSEIDLLIAHGVLHLLGFDHHDEGSAAEMRSREKKLTGRSGARAS